jgi:hypothetical protein
MDEAICRRVDKRDVPNSQEFKCMLFFRNIMSNMINEAHLLTLGNMGEGSSLECVKSVPAKSAMIKSESDDSCGLYFKIQGTGEMILHVTVKSKLTLHELDTPRFLLH